MKEYSAEAKKFYKSKVWENVRTAYAKSVDGLCERCLKQGIYTPGKIVHHYEYLDDVKLRDPEIALSFENLELLCQDCHNKEHHHTEPKRRYTYDAEGNIIKMIYNGIEYEVVSQSSEYCVLRNGKTVITVSTKDLEQSISSNVGYSFAILLQTLQMLFSYTDFQSV